MKKTTVQLSDSDAAALAISRLEGRIDELSVAIGSLIERSDKFISIAERCFDRVVVVDQKAEELALNIKRHETRLNRLEEATPFETLPPVNGANG